MKFIKLGVISFVLLFILLTGISLLLPSRIVVRRAVEINAPKDSVVMQLKDLNGWKDWLINKDTLPVIVSSKAGKDVLTMGNTSVSIDSISSQTISTSWRVNNGRKLPGLFSLITHEDNAAITVQWDFEQNIGWYPWEKFGSVASDKVLGPFMEQSLKNLKQLVENSNQR